MKWFRASRWFALNEYMRMTEPLANGYSEEKLYRKWVDLNHEGRTEWRAERESKIISPTGATTLHRDRRIV